MILQIRPRRKSPKIQTRIKRSFRNLEKAFLEVAKDNLKSTEEYFLYQVNKIIENRDINSVRSLKIDTGFFSNTLYKFLIESRKTGRLNGITEGLELKQYYEKKKSLSKIEDVSSQFIDQFTSALSLQNKVKATSFSVVPREALDFYKDYSLFLTGDIEQDLLKKAKHIIYSGIENGLSGETMKSQLENIFPFFTEGRLQNIARTEPSKAINQGRLEAFQSPDLENFVQGVEYSVIMDEGLCEICEARNGLILAMDNPLVAQNTPPLHYQCRCVWVPVDIYSILFESLQEKINQGWDNLKQPMVGFGGINVKYN